MKILIIQLRQLGDILLTSPLARAIKERARGTEVHFLTSSIGKEILKNNPFIDKVLLMGDSIFGELKTLKEVRKENYTAVIDVQRTGRSKRITFLSNAMKRIAFKKKGENFYYNTLIEWKNKGYTVWERLELLKGIDITIDSEERYLPEIFCDELSEKVLKLIPGTNFVVVVPTARKEEKMWNIENFAKLIEALEDEFKLKTVVCYAPGERKFIDKLLTLCRKPIVPESPLKIPELAALIRKAFLFVGNNSFASHLSVAVGTKTIVIDKKHSGWFPPKDSIREVYSENGFPTVRKVLRAAEELIGR